MDAKCKERRRDRDISRREKRWSMNSQRLEEIVAELMKPISDARRSFDTDLSALLEEYLTEAGLHALALEEDEDTETEMEVGAGERGAPAVAAVVPNFAELALLVQQSASIYGRKVDFLYQHVLNVSDSLHNSTQESSTTGADAEPEPGEAATPGGTRRKRKASGTGAGGGGGAGEFAHVALEPWGGARRAADAGLGLALGRPPPTLPRMYLELEPRLITDADAPLLDYASEPVGLLADFHVAWRLQDGLLVDELDGTTGTTGASLRPISLMELQAAIEAAAPPSPPHFPAHSPAPSPPPSPAPSRPPSPQFPSPLRASTPLPPAAPPVKPDTVKRERKRRSDVDIDDAVGGGVKLLISEELRGRLSEVAEFSVARALLRRVVAQRRARVLRHRRLRLRLRAHTERRHQDLHADFHGFDHTDIGGFPGWSAHEAFASTSSLTASLTSSLTASLTTSLTTPATRPRGEDSDDDGFFEQSSVESDASRPDDSPHLHTSQSQCEPAGDGGGGGVVEAEWWSWRARVVARAAAAEARGGVDVRALGAAVLGAAAAETAETTSTTSTAFTQILTATARDEADVSRLLLATLFLANAGNVEIVPGAPLTVDSFSVRVLSHDQRLYGAPEAAGAAEADALAR